MHTNLYKALCELILSKSGQVQRGAVETGCFQEVLSASENSQFFKVRRICNTVLDNVPNTMFELND